jgi:hypothetical protein
MSAMFVERELVNGQGYRKLNMDLTATTHSSPIRGIAPSSVIAKKSGSSARRIECQKSS